MLVEEFTKKEKGIQDLSYNLDKKSFTIRWKWPSHINIVYILKIDIFRDFSLDNIKGKDVRIYTREEYKEFNGYVETIKEINQYKYFVFPGVEGENEIILLKQNDGKNEILVTTGTPEICYEIRELKSFSSFFSKEKKLEITINSEVDLRKDVLCYVKKRGSYPCSKDDGICFEFVQDIYSGENIMPEIIVNRNEFVKLFIKDIEKYGNGYNLKKK